jgi:hypothetical protein
MNKAFHSLVFCLTWAATAPSQEDYEALCKIADELIETIPFEDVSLAEELAIDMLRKGGEL